MPLDIQLRAAAAARSRRRTSSSSASCRLAARCRRSRRPSSRSTARWGARSSKLAAKEEFTGKRDQALSHRHARTPPGRQGRAPAASASSARSALREVRTFAAKAARAANAEKAKSLALALPAGLEGRAARARRGARARRVPLHQVPDGRPQAEGGARQRRRRCGGPSSSPTRRRWSPWGRSVAAAVNLSRDLSNEPANVHLPGGASPPPRRPSRRTHGLEDRGLRLQGDPSPRDEAHRRRGPRQRARAAVRAHRVDAQGRQAEARLRRQGHHVRQRRPEHQARGRAWAR